MYHQWDVEKCFESLEAVLGGERVTCATKSLGKGLEVPCKCACQNNYGQL